MYFAYLGAQPIVHVNATILDQPLHDLVYDTTRQHLLLTIPSTDLLHGNSVGFFDPLTLTMDTSVFVGSEPGPLELTDNAQFAYVGTNGSGMVKKLDLNTFEIVSSVHMGYALGGSAQRASRISCQPGNDSVFAVVKVTIPDPTTFSAGVVFAGDLTFSGYAFCDDLRFKPNAPDRLVGPYYNGSTTNFRTVAVLQGEIDQLNTSVALWGRDAGAVSVHADTLLANNGTVVDISGDVPTVLGFCDVQETNVAPRSCLDPYQGLICIAYRKPTATNTVRIVRFDRYTFQAQDAFEIVMPHSFPRVVEILSWGPGTRYAINIADERLVVVNGEVVPTDVPVGG